MPEIKHRTFGHTAAALTVFDSTVAERARAWDAVETAEDIDAAERADIDALRPVQEAFHRDTSDINRLESCLRCLRMDLASLRKLAKGSAPILSGAHEAESAPDDAEGSGDGDSPAPR